MREPSISVIIPIYNAENYIAECLDSVMAQNFDGAEVICVDDGSTDSSGNAAEEYSSRFSSVKVIHKKNGGVSSARNTGLAEAKGDTVMFLDADDRLKEGALETVKSLAESEKNPDIIIFNADTFPEDLSRSGWYRKTLRFGDRYYGGFSAKVLFKERGSMPFVWRHAYKRELLERCGVRFDESLDMGEDAQFPMCVFPNAVRFLFASDCLVSHRAELQTSLTGVIHSDDALVVKKHFDTVKSAAKYWSAQGLFEKYGADFLSWAMKFTLLKVRRLKGKERKEAAQIMFGEIIEPFGLAKYKSSLPPEGRAMWAAFSLMR